MIAIIGYGNQGHEQANNLRDSGCKVIIGSIKDPNYDQAVKDRFEVYDIAEAARRGDIVHMLIPDEYQASVYKKDIEQHMKRGKPSVLATAQHPLQANRAASRCRRDNDCPQGTWSDPALDVPARFWNTRFARCGTRRERESKADRVCSSEGVGLTRIGVVETMFKKEVETDLFGGQVVLCGGVSELMKTGSRP